MELVFEVADPLALKRGDACSPAFGEAGGVIGRDVHCSWSIEDHRRLISGRHAQILYDQQTFYLIDVSRNGIEGAHGDRLVKGERVRVQDGAGFRFGTVEVVARLNEPGQLTHGWHQVAAGAASLDPLAVMEQGESAYGLLDELSEVLEAAPSHQSTDHTPADRDHIVVPRLVPSAQASPGPQVNDEAAAPQLSSSFWTELEGILGMQLADLDGAGRERLLLRVARLLKQSVGGLQRSLRNRDEVHAEICGGFTESALDGEAALDVGVSAGQALRTLLGDAAAPARQRVAQAFSRLQAHQLALLAGSRAVTRAALEHFSPQQLNWEFERDSSRPVINTAGSRWRAYLRVHHALSRNHDWSDELFARHFNQAYRDQTRLLETLDLDSLHLDSLPPDLQG